MNDGDLQYSLDNADARIEELEAEIKRLSWQPIETAPTDGTWVLTTNIDPPIWTSSRPNISAKDVSGEWWNIQDDEPRPKNDTPTHWMPLPTPPEV